MMKNYKSPTNRLLHAFKKSSIAWKNRALSYQKEKKELKLKVRDLRRSRNKWKEKCMALKAEVKELKEDKKKTKDLLRKIMNL